MKKFIVDSTIPSEELDPVACAIGIPKMLRNAEIKDTTVKTHYCCGAGHRKVAVDFEAPSKESLNTNEGR